MAEYRPPITVHKLIKGIKRNEYLLPAIQRSFVWDYVQIEQLFDSIMQGYPINTLMLWKIEDPKIYNEQRFYTVLNHYQERFQETNKQWTTKGDKGFMAIIDGQQRITALNIGLRGSFAYKKPRVWWPSQYNSKDLPQRELYLDLKHVYQNEEDQGERQMMYDFQFLTTRKSTNIPEEIKDPNIPYWFKVGDILKFPVIEDLVDADEKLTEYLDTKGLGDNRVARQTLNKLYQSIFHKATLHYYEETSQDSNRILEIFVRTNKGGTQLTYSDLIMSAAVSYWERDIKKEIDELVRLIRSGENYSFSIDSDFVLQACLMLIGNTIKFRLSYFRENDAKEIEEQWDEIAECIKAAFYLVKTFGINDRGLKAKNAVIPIIYYLYKKPPKNGKKYYEIINHPEKYREDKQQIKTWLFVSLLRQVFGGQGQAMLEGLRAVINDNMADTFPLIAIREKYKGTIKDINMDEDFIDKLLETQYNDSNCSTILSLLYHDFNFTREFEIDHMHPRSHFSPKALDKNPFFSEHPEKREFYEDRRNWNSILNLHPLYKILNQEKRDMPFADWFNREQNRLTKADILLPDVSLEFENFENFIEARKSLLKERLNSIFK